MSLSSLSSLSRLLVDHPNITRSLSVTSFLQFLHLIDHFKKHLSWHLSPDAKGPPLVLPKKVRGFCAAALGVEDQGLISECWTAFRSAAWGTNTTKDGRDAGDLVDLFLKHGVEYEIGMLFPLRVVPF